MSKDWIKNKTPSKELYTIYFAGAVMAIFTMAVFLGFYKVYQLRVKDNFCHYRQVALGRGNSITFFLKSQLDRTKAIASSQEVVTYFVNKALGMSINLGLARSIRSIQDMFERVVCSEQFPGSYPIFDMIVLFDSEGTIVASTIEEGHGIGNDEITKLKSLLPDSRAPRIRSHSGFLYFISPVRLRDNFLGWLATGVSWQDMARYFFGSMEESGELALRCISLLSPDEIVGTMGSCPEKRTLLGLVDAYLLETGTHHATFVSLEHYLYYFLTPLYGFPFYYVEILPSEVLWGARHPVALLVAFMLVGLILIMWFFWTVRLKGKGIEMAITAMKAQEALKAKTDFIAHISHEIRTPLNGILGVLFLLRDHVKTMDGQRLINMATGAGERLLILLNHILQLSTLEKKGIQTKVRSFDPVKLVEDAIDLCAPLVGDKDLKLYSLAGCNRILIGDDIKIGQVILNLITNAVKYTEKGWVLVSSSCDMEKDPPILTIIVEDTGSGIPPEAQARIFEAFQQLDESIEAIIKGTGLGLAIVREILVVLNGTMDFTSTPGKGTRFKVKIPVKDGGKLALPCETVPKRVKLQISDPILLDILEFYLDRWSMKLVEGSESWDHLILDTEALKQISKKELLAGMAPGARVLLLLPNGPKVASDIPDFVHNTIMLPLRASLLLETLTQMSKVPGYDAGRERVSAIPKTEQSVGREKGFQETCLVVDDNPVNQKVVSAMVKRLGMNVINASNGKEALDVMKKSAGDVSIILMDIQMPVMDGIEATKHIREELGLDIPVIACTAHVTEEFRKKCEVAGMDDYLIKPVNPKTLREKISRFLKKQRAEDKKQSN